MTAAEAAGAVLGVDGCRAGWVGAVLLPGAREPHVAVAADVIELAAWAGRAAGRVIDVIAIDIPIGLPDATVRQADGLARRLLPGRAATVFPVLTRAAYAAPDRVTADRINRDLTGHGVGVHAFSLAPKILEVDAWLRDSAPTPPVLEAHPELAFAAMAGEPLASKHTPLGVACRRTTLAAAGIDAPAATPAGAKPDDVLDACAVAWVARRYQVGVATPLPDPPEVFSDGLAAAIWR